MIARIATLLAWTTCFFVGVASAQTPHEKTPESDPLEASEPSAGAPVDPIGAVLDAEATRLREHLERLRTSRLEQERLLAEELSRHDTRAEQIVSLSERVASAAPRSEEADDLYEEVMEQLGTLRPRLRAALDHWQAPIAVPSERAEIDPAVRATPRYRSREAPFQALLEAVEAEEERLRGATREARWTAVDLRAIRADRLNALRVDSWAKLSFSKRGDLLSVFSEEGIARFTKEFEDLVLSLRVYSARREREIGEIPDRMRDVFRVGTVTWGFVKLLVLGIALVWSVRRWKPAVERAKQSLFRRVRGVRGKRKLETLMGAIEVLGPWTMFLLALYLARQILRSSWAAGEVELVYRVAFAYGAYRLGIDAAFALVVSTATRYRLSMDAARRKKLFLSIRAVGRLAAAIALLLSLSGYLLGRGYLFQFIVRLAWLFGVLIALRLLGRWRHEICEAYLKVQPHGRLADAVGRTRETWYGIFVAGASFGWLFGRGVAVLARDFALGFDQTRRALAFLFRKRIEKQAEHRGYAESPLESLPPALLEAFRTEPVHEGDLVLDRFPGMDVFEQTIGDWRAGRGGGAFAIHGPTGIGKTSWLARAGTEGVEKSVVLLTERPGSPSRFAAALGSALFPAHDGLSDLSALADRLRSGDPRIVSLDAAQNLFLSKVGGYDLFASFADLILATQERVFWLCSFNDMAWAHLAAVRQEVSIFSHRIALPAWSESGIRDLIRTRLQASQTRVTYEDLVVDRMEGVSAQSVLLQTEEGYTRLLWDYADGNPRVALHFWLRSVVPESEHRVRVRLFRAPESEFLEHGGLDGLFVLAAVVNHENLSLTEAEAVTRFPLSFCRIHLERFREIGALTESEDRYRLSTHWQRAAIRLLRRRNILSD